MVLTAAARITDHLPKVDPEKDGDAGKWLFFTIVPVNQLANEAGKRTDQVPEDGNNDLSRTCNEIVSEARVDAVNLVHSSRYAERSRHAATLAAGKGQDRSTVAMAGAPGQV
jgi:hypothetical protein